jgi:NADH-quinone oxidoreductase subunit L
MFPVHTWLPDAHVEAPTAGTVVLAAIKLKIGAYGFLRFTLPIVPDAGHEWAWLMIALSLVAVVYIGLVALVQDDIKKILAYSTNSQHGYMVAAIGVGGYTASVFHLFTHGFFKALLFLGAGSLIHAVHSNNISDMGGLRRFMPHTFWTFTIGSLALAGFPLTAGFFSKDEILIAGDLWAVNGFATGTAVYWVGLAAAFVTTFYMARAWFLIFMGEHRGAGHADAHGHDAHDDDAHDDDAAHDDHAHDDHADHGAHHADPHESGRQITVPLMILAVLSIAVGLIGSPFAQEKPNFASWTSTTVIAETTYPFLAEYAAAGTGIAAAAAEPSATIGPCLSSDASSYCTGVDLLVDGGFRCW